MSELSFKQLEKAEGRKKKTALAVAAALDKAVGALREHILACADCGDNKVLNPDDGRQRLRKSMSEYSHWLNQAFGSGTAS